MGRYELTGAADEDFENLFDYRIDTFGLDQALKYQDGMKQRFADKLAEWRILRQAQDEDFCLFYIYLPHPELV